MERKHIKLQSRAQDSQQREEKHPHKHLQNGTARLGILHSVSSTGEYTYLHGSIPSNLFLSHAHEISPSLAQYRDLWPFFSLWLVLLLALSDSLSVSQLSHHQSFPWFLSSLNPSLSIAVWCFYSFLSVLSFSVLCLCLPSVALLSWFLSFTLKCSYTGTDPGGGEGCPLQLLKNCIFFKLFVNKLHKLKIYI